jgi:hypothetical protein
MRCIGQFRHSRTAFFISATTDTAMAAARLAAPGATMSR